jgi:hypothetical protein
MNPLLHRKHPAMPSALGGMADPFVTKYGLMAGERT